MTTTTREQQTQDEANKHYAWFAEEVGQILRIIDQASNLQHYEWVDSLTTRILEDPLCVDLDSIDPWGDECKWNVLLGTGGPAVRILVTTDFGGSIKDAVYQYQNWFTPWVDAQRQDRRLLMDYAEVFHYPHVAVTLDGEPMD